MTSAPPSPTTPQQSSASLSSLATSETRRVKRGWMNLKVVKVIEETWDTKTFFLEDLEEGGRTWDYTAGQYLTFRYDGVSDKPAVRSYTMSSSPSQDSFCAVTVKRVEGGLISNWMCDNLKQNDTLRGRGPIGKFVYDPTSDASNLLMIAAGSGVTPFVSIMREYHKTLGQKASPKLMTLVVSYRSLKDLILWEDLCTIAASPHCNLIVTLSRDEVPHSIPRPTATPSTPLNITFLKGRLTMEILHSHLGKALKDTTIMSCGPDAIMNLAKDYGLSAGVTADQIKTESFA
jgi:ring-1,2-phenylacetyl-CoA epoxidase subunit PaaE